MEFKYCSEFDTENEYCFKCKENKYMIKRKFINQIDDNMHLTLISDEAGHRKIKDVLIGNYIIPTYQRGYRWESENVIKLLEDIYEGKLIGDFNDTLINEIKEDSDYELLVEHVSGDKKNEIKDQFKYCIQPLVMTRNGRNNEYDVIDGQQRLTTIAIIASALKMCKKLHGYESEKNQKTISIRYESRKESCKMLKLLWELPDNIDSEKLKNIIHIDWLKKIDNLNQVDNYFDSGAFIEECKDGIKNFKSNIDFEHILNSYKIAIYFFTKIENDFINIFGMNNICEYYDYLWYVLINCTEVIWYVIEKNNSDSGDIDVRKIFANFNTGKLPLTNSELIKAMFMNPLNYGTINNDDTIKDRQIVIAEKWDAIETELHSEDFWAFVPHPNQYNISKEKNEKYEETRIDIIFDFLVMKNWLEENDGGVEDYIRENKSNFIDNYYTFNKIEKWINYKLDKESSTENNKEISVKKREIMDECWDKVRSIFTCIKELYEDDGRNSGISSKLYNLVGFYIYACNMKNSSGKFYTSSPEKNKIYGEHRYTYLRIFKVMDELSEQPRKKRETYMLSKIREILEISGGKKEIEKFIKNIRYEKNDSDKIAIILLFYNISLLNKSGGIGNRFHFSDYAKQIWEREHIFAQNEDYLNDNSLIEERKAALKSLAEGIKEESEDGYKKNQYLRYVNFLYDYREEYCPILNDDSDEESFNNKVQNYIKKYESYSTGYHEKYRKGIQLGRIAQDMLNTYSAIETAQEIHNEYEIYKNSKDQIKRYGCEKILQELIRKYAIEFGNIISKNIKVDDTIINLEHYFTEDNIKNNLKKLDEGSGEYIYTYNDLSNIIEKKLCFNVINTLKRMFNDFITDSLSDEDRIEDFREYLKSTDKNNHTRILLIYQAIERSYKNKYNKIFEYLALDKENRILNMIEMNEDSNNIKAEFDKLIKNREIKLNNDDSQEESLNGEDEDNINYSIEGIKEKMVVSADNFEFIMSVIENNLVTMKKRINDFFEKRYREMMNDNSMGNATLLSKELNILVSNKPYCKKSDVVYKKYKEGSFVPLGTIFVFTDLYTKGISSARQWLPASRLQYLKNLTETISEYLGVE